MTGPVGKVQHSVQASAKTASSKYVMTKNDEFGIPFPMKTSDMLRKPIKTKVPQYEGSGPDTTYDAKMQKMFGGKAHIL